MYKDIDIKNFGRVHKWPKRSEFDSTKILLQTTRYVISLVLSLKSVIEEGKNIYAFIHVLGTFQC